MPLTRMMSERPDPERQPRHFDAEQARHTLVSGVERDLCRQGVLPILGRGPTMTRSPGAGRALVFRAQLSARTKSLPVASCETPRRSRRFRFCRQYDSSADRSSGYFLTVFLQQFYVYLTNVLTGCDSSHTKPQKRLESELTFIRGGIVGGVPG
ncbi:MAG: hypothetical protein ACRD3G_17055, partial [Vicinamibacterales bacterium]